MDFGEIVRDAFSFSKEGVFQNTGRWLRLILATLLLAIPFNGYVMRIYRGPAKAPEADQWGNLCIDGIKLMVVQLIYAIPILILTFLIYAPIFGALMSMSGGMAGAAAMPKFAPNPGLLVLLYIFEIVIAILLPVAAIRFARTGSFAQAFNFGGILETIGKIGWLSYILALIIVAVIVGIPVAILAFIYAFLAVIIFAVSGFNLGVLLALIALAVILLLVIMPLFAVFQARYMTRVYDSAAQMSPSASVPPVVPAV